MAYGAVPLVTGSFCQARKLMDLCALAARGIDHRPVIQPFLLKSVVLNWEDENPVIRESSRIRLLPLRSDGIVDSKSLPDSAGLDEFEIRTFAAAYANGDLVLATRELVDP